MTGIAVLAEMVWSTAEFAAVVLGSAAGAGLFAATLLPVLARLSNELTCRTVGKVVVICPHCGVPGAVESTHPKVIR